MRSNFKSTHYVASDMQNQIFKQEVHDICALKFLLPMKDCVHNIPEYALHCQQPLESYSTIDAWNKIAPQAIS